MLFTDGRSRIDHVLVWCLKDNDEDKEATMHTRRVFEQNLKEEGLILEHDIKVWIR